MELKIENLTANIHLLEKDRKENDTKIVELTCQVEKIKHVEKLKLTWMMVGLIDKIKHLEVKKEHLIKDFEDKIEAEREDRQKINKK